MGGIGGEIEGLLGIILNAALVVVIFRKVVR